MADGIGRIFGGESYKLNGYGAKPRNNETEGNDKQPSVEQKNAESQIDPNKVLDYLNASALSPVAAPEVSIPSDFDPALVDRIGQYMSKFEELYNAALDEFGDEQLAALITDMYSE